MGATSVTGVSGLGSVQELGGGNKGNDHLSLAVHRLIGPRVVMAEAVTLTGGTAVAYYPTLPGVIGQYSIQLTCNSSNVAWYSGFTTSQCGINGNGTDTVFWSIIKNGLWGSDATSSGVGANLANT
jgi:hypothetical protein